MIATDFDFSWHHFRLTIIASALLMSSCTEGSLVGMNGKVAGVMGDGLFRPTSGRIEGPPPTGEKALSTWNIQQAIMQGIEDTFARCDNFKYVPVTQMHGQPEYFKLTRYSPEFKAFAKLNGLDHVLYLSVTPNFGLGVMNLNLLVKDSEGKNVGLTFVKVKGNFPASPFREEHRNPDFLPIWRRLGAEAAQKALLQLQGTVH
jgi:hypothetical protein